MITLTKKYQIVYNGTKMTMPLEEKVGSETYVGEGSLYAEFDELEEAEAFIAENGLTYSEPILE